MQRMKRNQRGDTLVEVLIAITVLGIVVAGSMAVMNRSMTSILNSTERTAVRTDINAQINLINYAFRSSEATWQKIMNLAFTGKSDGTGELPDEFKADSCSLHEDGDGSDAAAAPGSFYLEPNLALNNSVSGVTLVDKLTEATNGSDTSRRARVGNGLWVDAVYYAQSPKNARPYVDFYVKACWTPMGNNPKSKSMTAYRLYTGVDVALKEIPEPGPDTVNPKYTYYTEVKYITFDGSEYFNTGVIQLGSPTVQAGYIYYDPQSHKTTYTDTDSSTVTYPQMYSMLFGSQSNSLRGVVANAFLVVAKYNVSPYQDVYPDPTTGKKTTVAAPNGTQGRFMVLQYGNNVGNYNPTIGAAGTSLNGCVLADDYSGSPCSVVASVSAPASGKQYAKATITLTNGTTSYNSGNTDSTASFPGNSAYNIYVGNSNMMGGPYKGQGFIGRIYSFNITGTDSKTSNMVTRNYVPVRMSNGTTCGLFDTTTGTFKYPGRLSTGTVVCGPDTSDAAGNPIIHKEGTPG